jgi:TatA/E family protein of Tat protein translocase
MAIEGRYKIQICTIFDNVRFLWGWVMGMWHLLIVLVIVFLIFGSRKLKNLGQELIKALKKFKDEKKP